MNEPDDLNESLPPADELPVEDEAAPPPPVDAPHVPGYEILGLLGEGVLGVVWRALQVGTARLSALRVLHADAIPAGDARPHFKRDVAVAAALDHPHLARIHESGWRDQRYCHATELIDGLPVDEYAAAHELSPHDAVVLMHQVCRAVHHAHVHGLVHSRLKPSNILVTEDGEPHVLDFGLGRLSSALDAAEGATPDQTAGALACVAPEQIAGEVEGLDTRTDVFALGAVLFRLVTGNWLPSVAGTANEVELGGDKELAALLTKALARDRDERYATAGELADDIARYLRGEPLVALPLTTGYVLRKRLGPFGVAVPLAAILLVWLASWVAWSSLCRRAERNQVRTELEQARLELRLTQRALERERATAVAVAVKPVVTPVTPTPVAPPPVAPPSLTERDHYRQLLRAAQQRLDDAGPAAAEALLWETPPALRHWEWGRLLLLCHRDLWTFQGHTSAVNAVAITADGRRMATGGDDRLVQVWDLNTTEPRSAFTDHTGPVTALAFAADGLHLVSASADQTVRIWTHGKRTGVRVPMPGGAARAVLLSADGQRVLAANGTTLLTADAATGAELNRRTLATEPLTWLAFSGTGRILVAGTAAGEVRVWDTGTGRGLWTFSARATTVAASPDGLWAAVAGSDGSIGLWNIEEGRLRATFRPGASPVTVLAFAPDGRTLFWADAARRVGLIEVATGRERLTWRASSDDVTGVAFTADGRRVATCSRDGATKLWATQPPAEQIAGKDDLAARRTLAELSARGATAAGLVLTLNDQRLFDAQGEVPVVRDVDDKAIVLTLSGISCVREVATGAAPRRVLVRDCNRTVHVLDAADWMQCRDEFLQTKLARYRQR